MTDFKRMADEYAAPGRVSGTEAIRRRAFLAGVDAALEAAAEEIGHRAFVCHAHDERGKGRERGLLDAAEHVRAMKVKP